MSLYLTLKWLHILSSVVLVGTGLGSAYYMFFANRSRDLAAQAGVTRLVVQADWWFTTPTVLLQPATGLAMVHLAGFPLSTPWIAASLVLYAVAGLCWLPVVWLQIRMQRIAEDAAARNAPLPALYWRMARAWFWLGVPAFVAMVLVVALMVFKHIPGAGS